MQPTSLESGVVVDLSDDCNPYLLMKSRYQHNKFSRNLVTDLSKGLSYQDYGR